LTDSLRGYVFLGQFIERLTGGDFEVYITKNILMPLGMTSSYFDKIPYFMESDVSGSYLVGLCRRWGWDSSCSMSMSTDSIGVFRL